MSHDLICLVGYSRSGKDYTANLIQSWFEDYQKFALADFTKRLFSLILSVDVNDFEKEKEVYRDRLIEVHEEMIKRVDRNFFVKDFFLNYYTEGCPWIISDVRFYHEMDYIKSKVENAYFIYVTRPNAEINTKCGQEIHPAGCDMLFVNNDKQEDMLREELERIL